MVTEKKISRHDSSYCKSWLKDTDKLRPVLQNEQGFSLIEIIVAVVILGTCFMLLATLIHQNSLTIKLNKRKEDAIFVREDIKEWLSYKGQIQDLANLNNYVFIRPTKSLDLVETARQGHFILDNTGIQTESSTDSTIKYGEIKIPETDSDRGSFVQKLKYHLKTSEEEVNFLPESLRTETNQLYMGEYVNSSKETTNFLVKVQAEWTSADVSYMPRTDGIDLTILIYDKDTGALLTSTVLNWVTES